MKFASVADHMRWIDKKLLDAINRLNKEDQIMIESTVIDKTDKAVEKINIHTELNQLAQENFTLKLDLRDSEKDCEILKAQVLALQSRIDEIEKQITEHNQMCIDLCANKTNCGFALYDRDCGNCKKDFMIEVEKS